MTGALPTEALSVMQPWTWLLANGWKGIENRSWAIRGDRFPRRILLHAGKKVDRDAHDDLVNGQHPVTGEVVEGLGEAYRAAVAAGQVHTGGIVGVATITGCVSDSDDPWFVGDYGFVMADAQPLPFMPFKGALSFFPAEYREP